VESLGKQRLNRQQELLAGGGWIAFGLNIESAPPIGNPLWRICKLAVVQTVDPLNNQT